ncbi:histidine phosphatase family protein [Synechococcus sp. PCC 7336]|uniref:histidine phosphatase family protein n=1 Tax=Synechococcus sp. PCC 7336 TaxID=195250 RepID=UPI000349A925|nr:histidine phosphatase family protein [Synechococcus sp. PCC 7336]
MGESIRVVIVRHGESTYNLEQRFQGRLDRSVLTQRGREQADCVGRALREIPFSACFSSPLQRARQTTDVIATALSAPLQIEDTPLLREIALYDWEGLRFDDVRDRFPADYQLWRSRPQDLRLGDRYPLRDLWQQAREFWQLLQSREWSTLSTAIGSDEPKSFLVVGHSGINRALIATALGLDETAYAQLGMNNCSISVLNFANGLGSTAQVESLNLTGHLGDCLPPTKGGIRLLLVRHGETEWNRQKRFQGQRDIPLNDNGELQARQAAAFLREQPLDLAFSSPLKRPWRTAEIVLEENLSAQTTPLELQPVEALQEISHGLWEGLLEQEIEANFPGQLPIWQTTPAKVQMPEGENLQQVWDRSLSAWQQLVEQVRAHSETATALVVAHDAVNKGILSGLMGLGPEAFWFFKQGNGAVSAIDYPYGPNGAPVLRAVNITSHIGGVLDCTAAGAL